MTEPSENLSAEEIISTTVKIMGGSEGFKEKQEQLPSIFKQLIEGDYYKEYQYITESIFNFNDEESEKLKQYIFGDDSEYIKLGYNSDIAHTEENENRKSKFARHVKLALAQRTFILENAKNANKVAEQAKRLADDAEKVKGRIYSEFIVILGIFTAITFSLSGSVQALSDMFKNVANPTNVNLGYALIVGAVYLIVIYLLVLVLFVGMRKIISNDNEYKISWWLVGVIGIAVGIMIVVGYSLYKNFNFK